MTLLRDRSRTKWKGWRPGLGSREVEGTWLIVTFSGTFKVIVDRTWIPRDKRKVVKTFFPYHCLQPFLWAHRLS